jgi:pimeloyl-ACP methyl ester carboxylesterase
MAFDNLFRKAFWGLAACGLIYALAMGSLTVPVVQRNVTYVHKFNPTYWQDLNNTEQFGFIHHQIQPFTITTPDNVTLFAWHILPTHLYYKHEQALKLQPHFGLKPFHAASQSVGLQLLLKDRHATAVVAFHGNAAHLASNYRPSAYQQMLGVSTPEKPVHVIAFDYRGFGLSTGSPTETGVVQDAVALMSALTGYSDEIGRESQAPEEHLDPSQIILVGQSMGTFIATAFYHEWVLKLGRAPFKALVLIASFTSLPNLIESYSFKGLTPPLLSPLMGYPRVQDYLRSKIEDKWDASSKLVELAGTPDVQLNLAMLHARNDHEIPWQEGRANWDHLLAAASNDKIEFTRDLDHEEFKSEDGKKRLWWERVRHGGHNRIQTSEQVRLCILRLVEGKCAT